MCEYSHVVDCLACPVSVPVVSVWTAVLSSSATAARQTALGHRRHVPVTTATVAVATVAMSTVASVW